MAVERKKLFCYNEELICLMFKNKCDENQSRGLAKIPYLPTVVSKDLF